MDTPTAAINNLDEARDAKCVPVAKGILTDMAESMKTADAATTQDFSPLLMKLLQRSLDADLNLTTENPYIFQLILGGYAAFSATIQKCSMAVTDDERFSKIGSEMMGLLASTEFPMGTSVTPEAQEQALAAITPQLEAIFEREHLTWLEIKYILEGMFNSLKVTEQLFSNNVQRSVEKMECKILGLDDMSDMTMGKLDETLKADMQ